MPSQTIRALELFSGIGGMHYALKAANLDGKVEVVNAVDISDIPNQVYRSNFPDTKHSNKNVRGLTAKDLNRQNIQMILMSPPCQPYTRQGKQKDLEDPRAKALVHIVENLLPEMKKNLNFLLLENVQGFEVSQSRDLLVKTLKELGFEYQEFLISPTHLGIPNSRLRYYLIAKKLANFNFPQKDKIWTDLSEMKSKVIDKEFCPNLSGYLESEEDDGDFEEFLVPLDILAKYGEVMDMVTKDSERSCCFTGAYGRYILGTGSIIQQSGNKDEVFKKIKICDTPEEKMELLRTLRLRYFTPKEIGSLMGFPNSLKFPESLKLRQRYKVLGNSLNVQVVSFLLQCLMM